MIATLIRRGKVNKVVLPQVPNGNYWISDKKEDKQQRFINIRAKNGKWQAVSDRDAKIISPKAISIDLNRINIIKKQENILNEVELNDYDMYIVVLETTNEIGILYCSPAYEDNLLQLDIKGTQELFIGNNEKNEIDYNNPLVSSKHARIFLSNGRWVIENLDEKFGTFVNNIPVYDKKILLNGDIIYIVGLKIIIIGNKLFINNIPKLLKYNPEYLRLQKREIFQIDDNTDELLEESELYSEEDYFSRSPRFTNLVERKTVKIDAPPQKQNNKEMPAILVLGSSLTMGILTTTTIISTISKHINGTSSKTETIYSIILSLVMMLGIIFFPILSIRWERRRKTAYEDKRQKRYKEYLKTKHLEIEKLKEEQKSILYRNYISSEQCVEIIQQRDSRLWERKIENEDFLTIRIGMGDVPLNIDLQYPEQQFSMEDDNLVELLNDLGKSAEKIENAPVTVSLVQNNISAIISQENIFLKKFIQDLIIQITAFHSYDDLKLVFFLKENKDSYLEYVKMLPHVWDDSKKIRFFANNYDEMKDVSKYLEEELRSRREYDNVDYKSFSHYYLIITDDTKKVKNLRIISEILKSKENLGFSILYITEDMLQLPNECNTFISINGNTGMFFKNEISSSNKKEIKIDNSTTIFFDRICQTLSNIPIKYTKNGSMILPKEYNFLEMYDVRFD